MEYKLRWVKHIEGWEARVGDCRFLILEHGVVHVSENPYYLNFTCYPSFETATLHIKCLLDAFYYSTAAEALFGNKT